jgi:membrane-associated protease RseP (regulator of RpoE activity)
MNPRFLILLVLALGIGIATASRSVTLGGKPQPGNVDEDRFLVVAQMGKTAKLSALTSLPHEAVYYFPPEKIAAIEKQLGPDVKIRILDHGRASRESEVVLELSTSDGIERFHYSAGLEEVTPLGSVSMGSELLGKAVTQGFRSALMTLAIGLPILLLVGSTKRNRDSVD